MRLHENFTSFESQLQAKAETRHTGNPFEQLHGRGKLPPEPEAVRCCVMLPFQLAGGAMAEKFAIICLPADLAQGLASTGHVEIID